jgi:hypothetical protein
MVFGLLPASLMWQSGFPCQQLSAQHHNGDRSAGLLAATAAGRPLKTNGDTEMKLFDNTVMYRVSGCAVVALLLVSCSGSDNNSSGAAANDGNGSEVPGTNPDATPLINALNARNLAIDLLEVVDITHYLGVDLPDAVLQLTAGDQPCAGAGSYTATTGDEQVDVKFSDCQLSVDSPAVLAGNMLLNIVSGDVTGDEHVFAITYGTMFSVTNGQRIVSADGQLGVSSTAGSRAMNSDALALNDSQGDILLTMLDSVETEVGAGAVTIDIAVEANLSRFGIEVVVATPAGLTGSSVSCPETGTMTIMAADGSVVSVEGAAGDNVLISQNANLDTVNCAEIATLADAGGQNTVLVPPEAPDSL